MINIFLNTKTNININDIHKLRGTIISNVDNKLTIQDSNNIIYVFRNKNRDTKNNDNIEITCIGNINRNNSKQDCSMINSKTLKVKNEQIPNEWFDNGIFKEYYEKAYSTLTNMSLDEKISQLILAHYNEAEKNYNYGGYLFFQKDFKHKDKDEVINMINNIQNNAKIPMLTAVDEEGGKIVRISNNKTLSESVFKSPRELYLDGRFNAIIEDVLKKSDFLYSLGINLNLAPVVDISTNPNDYIYERTLGENSTLTSIYSKIVIEASKMTKVSYTLKHFPGYGNNLDTHTGISIDNRSYEDIMNNDILPFKTGIEENAEAIMVSHNIVTSIDSKNPSSLSTNIHNLLRSDLKFTGIIITDDISMGALKDIDNISVKALLSGNDIIITSTPQSSILEIKNAINNGILSEQYINRIVLRILSWKYYKNLLN